MKIQIAYDGEAVRGGEMDVEDLAPALLAVGATLQEANTILNDGNARLVVKVKSDFKTGSFEVALELIQSLANQAAFLLDGAHTYSAKEIAELIGLTGGSTGGVIALVKWLKNRRVKSTTTLESGDICIQVDEDDKIVVKPEILKLTKNIRIRTSLHAVFNPLKKLGFDVFYVRDESRNVEVIRKDDVDSFSPPQIEEKPLTDTVRTAAYQLVGVVFEEGYKWKLSDGESKISADMKDDSFQKQIDSGRSFRKGDILVLKLRTKQTQTGSGIKNEHIIEEVVQHIPKAEQGELPL